MKWAPVPWWMNFFGVSHSDSPTFCSTISDHTKPHILRTVTWCHAFIICFAQNSRRFSVHFNKRKTELLFVGRICDESYLIMAKHHPDLIFCRKQPGVGKHFNRCCGQFQMVDCFSHFACSFPAIGRLCEKCDGKCVICDSYVRPCTLVRICDECNYGSYQGRCVICGGPGVSDAYYCKECTIQEKDVSNADRFLAARGKLIWIIICFCQLQRDGCPKIVNLGSSKTDLFYERKKYGFKQR